MTDSRLRISRIAGLLTIVLLAAAAPVFAQEVYVGAGPGNPYSVGPNPTHTQTVILTFGANTGGYLTSATFGWSETNCTDAVKVKFFRPTGGAFFDFVAERGPFSVTSPLQSGGTGPPVVQTVTLDPPVLVRRGDMIGLTNMTSCGGPTQIIIPIPLPGLPPPIYTTYAIDGDLTYRASLSSASPSLLGIYAFATGPLAGLGFSSGRFEVNLAATNPRTGATTTGTPGYIGETAGYFSLPDFTGDPTIPEVTVKLLDATTAPPPFGGAFWFFHSSLTDVTYTLTVTDHRTGRVRTYTNAGSPAFCGGADTNAFPP